MDAACVAELQASLARRDAVPFVAICRDALRQKAAFPALRQCVRELLAEVRQLARTNRFCNDGPAVPAVGHSWQVRQWRASRFVSRGLSAATVALHSTVPLLPRPPACQSESAQTSRLQAHDDEEVGLGDFLLSAVEVRRCS